VVGPREVEEVAPAPAPVEVAAGGKKKGKGRQKQTLLVFGTYSGRQD
jgi:hypothetical protein